MLIILSCPKLPRTSFENWICKSNSKNKERVEKSTL
jgi:hypothetical protein